MIGCLGGGMKQLESDLKELLDNENELDKTVYEMKRLFFGKVNRLFEMYCQEYCQHEVLYFYIGCQNLAANVLPFIYQIFITPSIP